MAPISILIADDSEIIRKVLRELLQREPERWVVCDEAADGPDALRKAALHEPEVILLDLSIPGLNGLDVAKELRERFPRLAIVIMSEQDASVLRHLAEHFGLEHVIPKSRLVLELLPLLGGIEAARHID
jgi:DNA-binding NarL/FixJ family response regulator